MNVFSDDRIPKIQCCPLIYPAMCFFQSEYYHCKSKRREAVIWKHTEKANVANTKTPNTPHTFGFRFGYITEIVYKIKTYLQFHPANCINWREIATCTEKTCYCAGQPCCKKLCQRSRWQSRNESFYIFIPLTADTASGTSLWEMGSRRKFTSKSNMPNRTRSSASASYSIW